MNTKSTVESAAVTMFLRYIRDKSISPCHWVLGGPPRPLTGEEMTELKNAFIKELGTR